MGERQIEKLPYGPDLVKPIDAYVAEDKEEGGYFARDLGIGLLIEGCGDTEQEALESLADAVAAQVECFQKIGRNRLVGLALHIADKLDEYVEKEE